MGVNATKTEVLQLKALLAKLTRYAVETGKDENPKAREIEALVRHAEEFTMAACREVCGDDGTGEPPYDHEVYVGWGLDENGEANTLVKDEKSGDWQLMLWNGIAHLTPAGAVEIRVEW